MIKKLLFLFTLLLTSHTFSQEEILGEWFLYEIFDFDYFVPYENYPDANIVFGEDENGYFYQGNSPCNSFYQDDVSLTTDYFQSYAPNLTLAECSNTDDIYYEGTFYAAYYYNQNDESDIIQYDYEIVDSGIEAILYIYNTYYDDFYETEMGYMMVYGRQPLSAIDHSFNLTNVALSKNPVTDYLDIRFNPSDKLGYEIFNLNGQKLLLSNHLNSNRIATETLAAGIYFIRFHNQKGAQKTIKFIKK